MWPLLHHARLLNHGQPLLSAVSAGFRTVIEEITYGYMLPVGGFLISIFCAWVWGKQRALTSIAEGSPGFRLGELWHQILKWLAPFIIFQIILGKILGDLTNYGIVAVPESITGGLQTVFFYIDAVLMVAAVAGAFYYWFTRPKGDAA